MITSYTRLGDWRCPSCGGRMHKTLSEQGHYSREDVGRPRGALGEDWWSSTFVCEACTHTQTQEPDLSRVWIGVVEDHKENVLHETKGYNTQAEAESAAKAWDASEEEAPW